MKVITMVGTSLFENYLKEKGDNNVRNYLNDIKEKSSREYDEEEGRINAIKKQINDWVNKKSEKEEISAEVKSLVKLKEKFKEEFEIYLLCSDTIKSKLAGEILKEVLNNFPLFKNDRVEFSEKSIIEDLQVYSADNFLRNGLSNLVERIEEISRGYWEDILINITGGYKVIIPYLTILAQINKVSLYYIFEETNELIHIPSSPLNINFGLFEKYSHILSKIEEGIENINEFKREVPEYDVFYSDFKTLLCEIDNGVLFNPLGNIFWRKYKSSLLLQVPQMSDYFRLTKPEKERIHRSVLELYERLQEVIGDIKERTKEKIIERIISLGENDLRHAEVIDRVNGTFIFKSTKETHIRLLYSFEINKLGEITSVIVYDFTLESFDHSKYIGKFKNIYPDLKSLPREYISIPNPKGGSL